MSAARQPRERPSGVHSSASDSSTPALAPAPAADMATLRSRRLEALRRRRLARLELGLGVLVAAVLLAATPGLAIAGSIAGVVLVLSAASLLVRRWRRRRRRGRSQG